MTPDGLKLPSVTTILDAIGKPALVSWAARTEREMVMAVAADLFDCAPAEPRMSKLAFTATLQNRIGKEKAHRKELRKAGRIGARRHRDYRPGGTTRSTSLSLRNNARMKSRERYHWSASSASM